MMRRHLNLIMMVWVRVSVCASVGGKCHHLDARIHHHGFIISILYNKFQNIPENVVKHERQLAYK